MAGGGRTEPRALKLEEIEVYCKRTMRSKSLINPNKGITA